MKFNTRFNCGDTAWIFDESRAVEATVGQIRIQYTKSRGVNDGYTVSGCSVAFDNYKPQPESYEEVYMCDETGINSGTLHTLGKSIFATKEECELANAERLAKLARIREEHRQDEERRMLAREGELRRELARIEMLKAKVPA